MQHALWQSSLLVAKVFIYTDKLGCEHELLIDSIHVAQWETMMTKYFVDMDTVYPERNPEQWSATQKFIHKHSSQQQSAAIPEMQDAHLAETAAKLFFTGHWSRMTVARTTLLSTALDEGSYPSDAFLYVSALGCIDTVYKLISNTYSDSFEKWRHMSDDEIAVQSFAEPPVQKVTL